MTPKPKSFKGLPIGYTWKDRYGDTYEITCRYSIKGHRFYHVKLNGKHIGEKAIPSSIRLIPEEEVIRMKG